MPTAVAVVALLGCGGFLVGALCWYGKRTTRMLRRAQAPISAAFDHASIGLAVIDARGTILRINRSLAEMSSVGADDVVGAPVHALARATERAEVMAAVTEAQGGRDLQVTVRLSDDAETRWARLTFTRADSADGADGSAGRLVLQVEDVTDRRQLEDRLAHQAGHDSLTGLPNRSLLVARIAQALASTPDRIAVMCIDLDRFKHVNDACGHSAADRMLVEVAERLRDVVRPGDVVARRGGDEFVVLCHDVSGVSEVVPIADRIVTTLSVPFVVDGEVFHVGASIGTALPAPGDDPETLLRDADTAMHQAKDAGGGRLQVFVPSMRAAALRRHELEAALRSALSHDELELHYQPTVDLRSRDVCSMEALLRWHHPVRGAVSPSEFIPVAEETDLIIEIGTWVLRAAMQQSVEWTRSLPAGRAPSLGINVSRRQLAHVDFVELVADLLTETGADPAKIFLEVTETALSGAVEPLVDALQALKRLGVRLAIDDFGTGHASLTYLARFPVDILKIDRSFVMGLGDDAGSNAIVSSVTAMGHAFGLAVVAEGVESDCQLAALLEAGCDVGQGYLFSRPLPAAQATAFMLRGLHWPDIPPQRVGGSTSVALGPAGAARPQRRAAADTARRYRLLLDLARDVTGSLDLQTAMDRTFASLRQITHFTGGSIQLVDDDGQIGIAAADPPATEEAMTMRIPLGQGVSGGIAATGEPRYIADITAERGVTSTHRRRSTSSGVRSYFGVPLICAGRVIGILQIDSVEPDAWSEDDRLLVLAFAPIVAGAVDNARHFGSHVAAAAKPV